MLLIGSKAILFRNCLEGDGDVQKVTIMDVSRDYNDGLGTVEGKEVSLFVDDENEEKAEIKPKKSMFSKNFQVRIDFPQQ